MDRFDKSQSARQGGGLGGSNKTNLNEPKFKGSVNTES